MNSTNTFEDFLANQAPQIDLVQFVMNLGVAGLLAGLMAYAYAKWGRGQSHRSIFAGNFYLITMTTLLVISVVKSSLALSLGLVGALSVIRFRTAIKDPEELSFLFLSIAIGLGLGADQRPVTIAGVIAILIVYVILKFKKGGVDKPGSLYFHMSKIKDVSLQEIEKLLLLNAKRVKLKRSSEEEAVFLVELKTISEIDSVRKLLKEKLPSSQILITEYQDLA
ncbi:MAG: DUF4956 domain-containing protein [Bacteriovoracaceae bacterium]|nr:DUF4956 domain-containing protein [Bacteriovoracaceae bacterium]